jgi:uncharacterized protein
MTKWLTEIHAAILPREVKVDVGGRASFVCRVASSVSEQQRGLQGLEGLPPDSGLYFPFNPPRLASFHMGHVRFPIDIVFLDGEGRVARVVEAAPGSSDRWSWPLTCGVLEVNGGACKQSGVRIGDRVRLGFLRQAKTPTLPDGWEILSKVYDGEAVFSLYDTSSYKVGFIHVIKTTKKTSSGADQWKVQGVRSAKGYGPLLYDAAMKWVTKRGGWLKPDTLVSDSAAPIWEYYEQHRPDVEQEFQTQRPRPIRYAIDEEDYQRPRGETSLTKRYRMRGSRTAAARPLPEGWSIAEHPDIRNESKTPRAPTWIFVMHDDFGYEVGQINITKRSRLTRTGAEQWYVSWVEANPVLGEGMGPTLYDHAMRWVTNRGGWLSADPKAVSDEAAFVWIFYDERRMDVDKELQTERPQPRRYLPEFDISRGLRDEFALTKRYRLKDGSKTYDLAHALTTAGAGEKEAGPGDSGFYHLPQERERGRNPVDQNVVQTDMSMRHLNVDPTYSSDMMLGEPAPNILRPDGDRGLKTMKRGPEQTLGGGSMNIEDPHIEELHRYPVRAQRIFDPGAFMITLHKGMVEANPKWEPDIVNGRVTESLVITPADVADWMKRAGATEMAAQQAKQAISTREGLELLADVATRYPELFGSEAGRVDQVKIFGTKLKLFRGVL